jgi:hypothetical protein
LSRVRLLGLAIWNSKSYQCEKRRLKAFSKDPARLSQMQSLSTHNFFFHLHAPLNNSTIILPHWVLVPLSFPTWSGTISKQPSALESHVIPGPSLRSLLCVMRRPRRTSLLKSAVQGLSVNSSYLPSDASSLSRSPTLQPSPTSHPRHLFFVLEAKLQLKKQGQNTRLRYSQHKMGTERIQSSDASPSHLQDLQQALRTFYRCLELRLSISRIVVHSQHLIHGTLYSTLQCTLKPKQH